MRMLQWITGNTRKDRLQNEEICLKTGMTPINEKKRRVTWDCLVICIGKQLMHQWEPEFKSMEKKGRRLFGTNRWAVIKWV